MQMYNETRRKTSSVRLFLQRKRLMDQRIFQVGNPIIYQAYCVPLLYESRTVTPCHPPGCAYR